MKKLKKKFYSQYLPKIVGNYLNVLGIIAPEMAAKKALDIFCTPRKGKLLHYHEKFLENAKSEILKYNDLAIQTYHWKGTGTKILLCHGWESNTWRWRKLINHFKDSNFDIYAIDGPAHGGSSSKYFNGALYAEFINVASKKYNPAVILGHSIGAFSVLMSSSLYPNQHISKIVTLGAADRLTDITYQYFNIIGLKNRVQKAYFNLIPNWFGEESDYFSSSLFVKKIDQKGLIIHDVEDPTNPYSDSVSINNNWNNSRLYSTTGLGHSLQSKKVFDEILQFIISV